MSVEESVPYLLEKKLELIKYILMMESQMEEVKIRWTSKNNEPRREEYLHADLENLNQQYKSVVLSSPAVDTFKEALLIILPIDE